MSLDRGRDALRAAFSGLGVWGWGAMAVLAVIVLSAILAPLIAPDPPTKIDALYMLRGPTGAHPFGTDELGRDLLSRVLYGGRISLAISAGSTVLAMVIGTVWGATAALGTWVDSVIMRVADAVMAVPLLLFALMLVTVLGSSELALVLILGLLISPLVARVSRIALRAELALDYCLAARASGTGSVRLLVREAGPNVVPVLTTLAVTVAAGMIGLEATISFLGLGIQPPAASWGSLVQGGYANLYSNVTYMLFPSLFIVVTIWALNVLADALRETLAVGGGERRRFKWMAIEPPSSRIEK